MASSYFQELYTSNGSMPPFRYSGLFPSIPQSWLTNLDRSITKEETRRALFEMAPLKSPGADGLHAMFFQSQWEVVGDNVFAEVERVFNGGCLDHRFNRTLLALIPKTDHPQTLKEFRPISLCSTFYKLITNRLKPIMQLLVQPQQVSFIKGRSITDNIIIAQEVIHSMRRKGGKTGWMATKIDLEKAFDRLSWDFIDDTLVDANIPERLRRLIMHCVTTSSMQVLWNGQPTSAFHPQRGIRQGDPLSPYIFVLCIERLSQAISQEVYHDSWKPIQLKRGGPLLSHLFFADDLILFNIADTHQSA